MGQDSNLCTLARAELQSAAINHSATHPRVQNANRIKKGLASSVKCAMTLFMTKAPKKPNSSPKKPGSGTAKGPGKTSRYIPTKDKVLKKAGKPGKKTERSAAPSGRDERRDDKKTSRPSQGRTNPASEMRDNRPKQMSRERNETRDARPRSAPRDIARTKSGIKADLFGMHAVREAWKNPKRYVHSLYITENALEEFKNHLEVDAKRPEPTIVTKEELDRAFPSGTVHQGVALSVQNLAETSIKDIIIRASEKPRSVIVMLDQVTDPHNIGAILRSACAFGADGVVMQSKHAPEMTGILAKTACGAVEHTPVAYETNLSRALETLQENHYTVIGLDEHAEKNFTTLPKYERVVIVMGAEGSGMRRLIKEHCDVLVTLPTMKPINSLNVSNAAAVALYALTV
jgi:23S rRNA (guanosine2251-2'-O)-methyltransferase